MHESRRRIRQFQTRTFAVSRYWRECVLALVPLLLLAGIMATRPLPQDLAYHDFADKRAFLGMPNFFDVASNIPFLLVGIAGAALCLGRNRSGATASWSILFFATVLVALGSAYYHWAPDNATLVWDRLPMTIGFMGLFVALVSEHVNEKFERVMLVPALVVGAASVAWWHFTDDLRLYVWVQLAPLVILLLVVVMFSGRYTHRTYLLYGLGFYLLAKFAEYWDREFFALTANALSGHSLKHLLAACGLLFVYLMLRWREPGGPQQGRSSAGSS